MNESKSPQESLIIYYSNAGGSEPNQSINSKVEVEPFQRRRSSSQLSDSDRCISRQYLRRPPSSLYKYPPPCPTLTTGKPTHLLIYTPTHIMSGFKNFAIVGAGNVGGFIVEELLKQKAAGSIDEISIVSRPVRPRCSHRRLTRELTSQ